MTIYYKFLTADLRDGGAPCKRGLNTGRITVSDEAGILWWLNRGSDLVWAATITLCVDSVITPLEGVEGTYTTNACDVVALQPIGEFLRGREQQAVWASLFGLRYIQEHTPELCEAAVAAHPYALQFVKDQTPALCLVAVQLDGCAIKCVRDQTPDLCEAAVRQNAWALRYVHRKTPELRLLAAGR